MLVRTDLCSSTASPSKPPAKGGKQDAPRCLLLGAGNTIARNRATDGVGGGLLVTNVPTAFTTCGGAGARFVPLEQCWREAGGAAANGSSEAALAARGLPYGNRADSPGTDNLASTAARLVVTCVQDQDPTAAGSAPSGCRGSAGGSLVAPPGKALQVDVAVQDWQGAGMAETSDASMLLQVSPRGVSLPSYKQWFYWLHMMCSTAGACR